MMQAPNVHDAEPIPEDARAEIDRLLAEHKAKASSPSAQLPVEREEG